MCTNFRLLILKDMDAKIILACTGVCMLFSLCMLAAALVKGLKGNHETSFALVVGALVLNAAMLFSCIYLLFYSQYYLT